MWAMVNSSQVSEERLDAAMQMPRDNAGSRLHMSHRQHMPCASATAQLLVQFTCRT
jgi:hypothetical protein